MEGALVKEQQHGKAKVRVARAWRGQEHTFVEWTITILLSSDCNPAYEVGDNSSIVATDSIKNTVYAIAKTCSSPVSVETFGLLLSSHFVGTYKVVTGAHVSIVENSWERVFIQGAPHPHGKYPCFFFGIFEVLFFLPRFQAWITEENSRGFPDKRQTSGGCLRFLRPQLAQNNTGFIRDKFTLLPEVTERLLASTITAKWRYAARPRCYTEIHNNVVKLVTETFFGPPSAGVYSPSVQNTLYLIGQKVLQSIPDITSIELSMPNLHFLPVNLPSVGVKFEHDVYLPTSEPHGVIQACLVRRASSKL